MEENTTQEVVNETVANETNETTEAVETTQEVKPSKNDLLRELSKEYGVNLFDAEGIAKFKEYTESQKTEQQKLQEQLQAYEDEKASWQSQKLEYESKLKASELGIKGEYLEDALKLANNDPDKLGEVLKKYPIFKSTDGIQIGVQENNAFQQPNGDTEVDQYIAQNYSDPKYAKYIKKK